MVKRLRRNAPRSHAARRLPTLLGVGALWWSLSPAAHAASGPPVAALVPPGQVRADGSTEVQLSVLVLDAEGAPWAGLGLRARSPDGRTSRVRDLGGGAYSFTFRPHAAQAPREVSLDLRLKGSDIENTERSFSFGVLPPLPDSVSVEADPRRVVLGESATSTLSLNLRSGADEPTFEHLEVQAQEGTISNLSRVSGGRIAALYTAPDVRHPHLDILTVADRRVPGSVYGHQVISLVGNTRYPVNAPAGSTVILSVAGREFGPVPAGDDGVARVPVQVPPGVGTATVITSEGESSLDLAIPPSMRFGLLPLPEGAPGGPEVSVPIRVVVATPEGQPDPGAPLQVLSSLGSTAEPVHEGRGIYRVDYAAPAVEAPCTVTFNAFIEGEPEDLFRQAELKLVPAMPASLRLEVQNPEAAPGDPHTFHAVAVDAAGQPVLGREVRLRPRNARLQGSVRELGKGRYEFQVLPQGESWSVQAFMPASATGNPVSELLLVPQADRLPADGEAATGVAVLALDGFGHPVPEVEVSLSLISGDGALPASVSTGEDGIGWVDYTAGSTAGLVAVQATSGAHRGATALYQGSREHLDTVRLGTSGTERVRSLRELWASRLPVHRTVPDAVEPPAAVAAAPAAGEPEPAPAATPPAVQTSSGPTTQIEVDPVADQARPGSDFTVQLTALDEQGHFVTGQTFEILSSTGVPGEVQEQGAGRYIVVLPVPADLAGDLKFTVSTPDGAISRFVRIPVAGEAGQASVWHQEPSEQAASGAEKPAESDASAGTSEQPSSATGTPPTGAPSDATTKAPRQEPRASHPWLHLRAAVGSARYGYQYGVLGTPVALDAEGNPVPYGESLVLEGSDRALVPGGEPAPMTVPAVDARLDAWIPGFPYLGVDLRYRGTWFGVHTDAFAVPSEGIDMSWGDLFASGTLQARYFHDFGPHRIWLGGHGGWMYTSVPLVAAWTAEEGERGLWFVPWTFGSLYGGLRGGAELGFGVALRLDASWGTERYAGLAVRSQTAELGFALGEHWSLDLGLDHLARHAVVPDSTDPDSFEPVVEVDDERTSIYLGLGLDL